MGMVVGCMRETCRSGNKELKIKIKHKNFENASSPFCVQEPTGLAGPAWGWRWLLWLSLLCSYARCETASKRARRP